MSTGDNRSKGACRSWRIQCGGGREPTHDRKPYARSSSTKIQRPHHMPPSCLPRVATPPPLKVTTAKGKRRAHGRIWLLVGEEGARMKGMKGEEEVEEAAPPPPRAGQSPSATVRERSAGARLFGQASVIAS
ncbi:hypothetical protein ZWY2020_033769 [Hordeum vulgare]|nr:hypothetical protein ZWY2020_033769 [Hordeum vulgare]